MGILTQQAHLLLSIQAFDRKTQLRRTPMGTREEELQKAQEVDEEDLQRRKQALKKLLAIRRSPDKAPCRVMAGLYVGGIGAASNLRGLQKNGVTTVLCVSAVVPRFYPADMQYKVIPVYDDAKQDILPYLQESNDFIQQGLQSGGVLIHCFAGQSRSVAFLIAYLIGVRKMGLPQAWKAIVNKRPSAHPNSGFVKQLAEYARQQNVDDTIPCDMLA